MISPAACGLAEHGKEDRGEIKEIRRDLRDLAIIVQRLHSQVAQTRPDEREMMLLRLENRVLRGRCGLPVTDTGDG